MSALLLARIACVAGAEYGSNVQGGPDAADVDFQLTLELNAKSPQMKERVLEFAGALGPSYAALPKNQDGNLPHQTARYILHRLFVDRHGWYIKGLDPNGDVFHDTQKDDNAFEQWVPSFLIDDMEKKVGHKGLGLNELAVLAAAMEDLVNSEATDLTMRIYDVLAFHKGPPATMADREHRVKDTIRLYMASFLSGAGWDAAEAYHEEHTFFSEDSYHLGASVRWYEAIVERHLNETKKELGFEVAKHIAVDVGAEFAGFNQKQCTDLKATLIGSWARAQTTGRMRLADFYRMGMESQWAFNERKGYLKALGALDESNMSSPMIIIPNYLSSKSNCLDATELYAACCKNECEEVLGYLERSIKGPSATPELIAGLISRFPSGTVQAPRELDARLIERLTQIADVHDHGGRVKLHGRLFAQWLHHAYPNECPYPHEAGTANPSSPEEWMGADVTASAEEMQQVIDADSCGSEQASDEWAVELPWSHSEELLPHHDAKPLADDSPAGSGIAPFFQVLWLVAILGVVVALAFPSDAKAMVEKISLRHLSLAALALFLVATNMVNGALLVVMGVVGLGLHRILAMGSRKPDKLAEKLAGCMV